MTNDHKLQGLLSALAREETVCKQFLMTRQGYESICSGEVSARELFKSIKDFVDEFLGASKEAGVSFPSGITEERVRSCLESSILHWHFSIPCIESGGPPRKKAKTQQ